MRSSLSLPRCSTPFASNAHGLFEALDIPEQLYAVFFENLGDVVIDRFTVDPKLLQTRCQRFEMLVVFPDTVPQVGFQLEPGQINLDLVERTG
jgi:hypothetical protein